MEQYLSIHKEVQEALHNKQPVIALESTLIAHGMPFPENEQTAIELEAIARAEGVVPATIAVLNGKFVIGVTDEQRQYLAKQGSSLIKASRQDLPYLLSQGKSGATTVAATMIGAQLAGIKLFATGGIGGVHRGAFSSFDISADLQELAKTSVAVICAGAKAILDLSATVEYLETHGIPLLGYQTEELPAFYTRKSGLKVNYQVDTPKAVVDFLKTKWTLGLNGGVVIANPIPKAASLDEDVMNTAIETALKEEKLLQIHGKESTPYLLNKVKELTDGKSLEANRALIKNNVRLACAIAKEFYP